MPCNKRNGAHFHSTSPPTLYIILLLYAGVIGHHHITVHIVQNEERKIYLQKKKQNPVGVAEHKQQAQRTAVIPRISAWRRRVEVKD